MTNLTKLRSSLLDKTKEFALILSPTLLKNLILVGCAILLKETVNLNKLKNALGLLLENEQTLPNAHYRRLTRFFDGELAQRHLWKWLMRWLMDYIRQWDGRQTRLFVTLDVTCLSASPVAIGPDPHPVVGTESGLSGHQSATLLVGLGQKRPLQSAGTQAALADGCYPLRSAGLLPAGRPRIRGPGVVYVSGTD